jgi:hypothetical protein
MERAEWIVDRHCKNGANIYVSVHIFTLSATG